MVEKRLEDLERQISMYERLFQSFSSKLDHHFKKYDLLISSQQQQINMLMEAVSTMLNDQYRYSEILRDKLASTLASVNATHMSISGINSSLISNNTHPRGEGSSRQPQHRERVHRGPQQQSQNPALANVNAFLEDFITPEMELSNPAPKRAKLGSFQTKPTTLATNNNVEEGFRPLEVDVSVPVGVVPPQHVQQERQQQSQQQQSQPVISKKRKNSHSISSGSNSTISPSRSLNQSSTNSSQSQQLTSHTDGEKYYPVKQHGKKRKIYDGKFKFFNSPQSIIDIWKEYTEGFDGQPSIKEMEEMYHVSWRREPAMNKRYHRRRVLCKAIEKGLEKGFHLPEILRMLENSRIADPERGTKHPISWICQFSHIPEILR